MKSFAVAAGLAGLAMAAPQAAQGSAPQGCSTSYNGQFEITIVKPSGMSQGNQGTASNCGQTGILTLNLQNGVLTDNDGRTGYIAGENQQFQFDKPVQAGASITSGFSLCSNGSLALGSTTNFYQCQSGGFYNLYYANTAAQCSLVNIDMITCSNSTSSASGSATASATSKASGSAAPVSVSSDGQPQGTAAATNAPVPVSVSSDGQPQATAAATSVKPAAVSQFTDGQPQATVAATTKSNATVSATASPTIAVGGAANLGYSTGLIAAVAGVAAYFL